MKYGQIAGNKSINAAIYRCFGCIHEEDAQTFVKRFREQPHDQDQVMHTFRELILGGFLASNGLQVRYDQPIDGKTPDWSIVDHDGGLRCIVELINFHIYKAREDKIKQHWQTGRIWCGWTGSNTDRLYDRIWDKAVTYKELVGQTRVAYVIALFGDFIPDVDPEEVQECLFDTDAGLFALYPEVSGLLFFAENSGRYGFTYIGNPGAIKDFDLPSGVV
jgi:hypothetical protein